MYLISDMHPVTIIVLTLQCLLISHQICDDTNQAKGFAAVGTTGGIGRLMVCPDIHSTSKRGKYLF